MRGASSSALTTRPRWPSSYVSSSALGNSVAMMRALTSGMIGSSVPATMRVGCRMRRGTAGSSIRRPRAVGAGSPDASRWASGCRGAPSRARAGPAGGHRRSRRRSTWRTPGRGSGVARSCGSGHGGRPAPSSSRSRCSRAPGDGIDTGSGRQTAGPSRRPTRCQARRPRGSATGRAATPSSRRATRTRTASGAGENRPRRECRSARPESPDRARPRTAGAGRCWRRCRCTAPVGGPIRSDAPPESGVRGPSSCGRSRLCPSPSCKGRAAPADRACAK